MFTRKLKRLLFWLSLCLFTLVSFIIVRSYFFQTFRIVSDSMLPTLQRGDRVLVYKDAYSRQAQSLAAALPKKRDIVVFSRFSEFQSNQAGKHYIKRIVGVPGERLAVAGGVLLLEDAIDSSKDEIDYGPITLQAGQYFVSGDNRSDSKDSRFFGPIRLEDIEGKAIAIVWSSSLIAGEEHTRWERMGKLIE